MSIALLTVQAVLFSIHIKNCVYVTATTITVPEKGFTKESNIYIEVTKSLEWEKAADVCRTDYNAHLVTTNTLEDIAALRTFVANFGVGNHFWIGLQWSDQTAKLWNDGYCTPVSSLDNYKDANSENFNSAKQCYAAHDTHDLNWESFSCTDKKKFVCESKQVVTMDQHKMAFHIIQYENSTADLCGVLCMELEDCFMASAMQHACVVAVASATPDTYVIDLGTTSGHSSVSTASSGAATPNPPTPCHPYEQSNPNSNTYYNKSLSSFTLLDGIWAPSSQSLTCPEPSPSVVLVTSTVTEISVQMSTVVSLDPVHTCTVQPETTVLIQPTTVMQVQTSVVIETTVVPSYVTVTTMQMESCSPVFVTETANGCTTDISSTIIPTQSDAPYLVASESLASDITDRLRAEIYETLHVDPKELSKNSRSKNSAENKMASSVAIGFSFSLIGVIFLAVIIVSDMTAVFNHIRKRMLVNIRSLCTD